MSGPETRAMSGPETRAASPDVQRLSRLGKAWRLGVVAVCLAILTSAQLVDTDDYFPLGRLSQYATGHGLDGTVRSAYVLADTPGGEQVRVPLNPTGVGVGRAEIEGQLNRIIDDPSLLQGIADAWAELHPDQPQYVRLYLKRDIFDLVDGRPTGERETIELARWEVEQ